MLYMTSEDKERIIRQIMQALWKNRDMPPRLQAERIFIDCLEKSLNDQRDVFERLMFVDLNNPN